MDKSLFNSCICWFEYQLVYNKKVNFTPESEWSPESITSFDACKSIVTRGIDTLPLADEERDYAEYILFEIYLNKFHQNNDLDSIDWKKIQKNYIKTGAWGRLRNLKHTWFGNYPNKCSCFSNELNK
jgi:hypothetical protein